MARRSQIKNLKKATELVAGQATELVVGQATELEAGQASALRRPNILMTRLS